MTQEEFRLFLNRCSKEPEYEHLSPEDAKGLLEVSNRLNGGRGCSVARSVATYLEKGYKRDAATVYRTDHDKVRQYPELHAYMNSMFRVEWK